MSLAPLLPSPALSPPQGRLQILACLTPSGSSVLPEQVALPGLAKEPHQLGMPSPRSLQPTVTRRSASSCFTGSDPYLAVP